MATSITMTISKLDPMAIPATAIVLLTLAIAMLIQAISSPVRIPV